MLLRINSLSGANPIKHCANYAQLHKTLCIALHPAGKSTSLLGVKFMNQLAAVVANSVRRQGPAPQKVEANHLMLNAFQHGFAPLAFLNIFVQVVQSMDL